MLGDFNLPADEGHNFSCVRLSTVRQQNRAITAWSCNCTNNHRSYNVLGIDHQNSKLRKDWRKNKSIIDRNLLGVWSFTVYLKFTQGVNFTKTDPQPKGIDGFTFITGSGNLFMEVLEVRALESSCPTHITRLRYIDDTFLIWWHGNNDLKKFLNQLSRRHSK